MQRCSSGDPRITLLNVPMALRTQGLYIQSWEVAITFLLNQIIIIERIIAIAKSINKISTTEIFD